MNCQKCGSDNVRTFSVVFEEGTSHGHSNGHVDGFATNAYSFHQSPLAAKCSPPVLKETGGFIQFLGFVLAVYLAAKFNGITWSARASELTEWSFILSILGIGLVLIFCWGFFVSGPRETRHQKAMNQWRQSWVCLRCGATQVAQSPAAPHPAQKQ